MTERPSRPPRIPTSTAAVVAVLLLIPCLALAAVPVYSRESPHLFGWPFFYWYQLVWVIVTPVLTYTAYVLIKRARSPK